MKKKLRSIAKNLGRTASQWQCKMCGTWFESDSASQTCPGC